MLDLVGHIGNAISTTGGLIDIFRKADNAAFIKQISDLNIQLAVAQNEAARLLNENRELKAEIDTDRSAPLRYDEVVYRDAENYGYCPACYDDRRKRIHLKEHPMNSNWFVCPICDNDYEYP